ncbi:MAG: alpha/beta fold hydrolase [Pseudomonadota bacterium]
MRCAYANIGTADRPRLIHYRTAGEGPPLLMLHASPLSSKSLVPLAEALAPHATVLALDTPGYGQSDPLAEDPRGQGLSAYVEAIEGFRRAMGYARVGVYGTATGAQIAIEYARAYPERCSFLIADNAAHFSDDDREAITDGYFPDLTVDDLGGHLIRTWSLARDQLLFFPWQDPAARLPNAGLDPAFTDIFARQILEAGPRYAWAYREAFFNEKAERLLAVTVPTTLMRWAGSIIKPYTDRFDEYEIPAHFRMQVCGPSMGDRISGLIHAVTHHQNQVANGLTGAAGAPAEAPRTYIDRLHLRVTGSGRPLLLLHQPGFVSRTAQPLATVLGTAFRCLAPDLPGHGASGPSKDLAADVVELYERLAETEGESLPVLALGESAALATLLHERFGCPMTLLNPRPVDNSPDALPALGPRSSGAHWLEIWHWLRMRQMFAPWYKTQPDSALTGTPVLDGETLTAQLKAVLACTDLPATLAQLAALPSPNLDRGRWLTLAETPLGDAARKAFPDAPWQSPIQLHQLAESLED